MTKAVQKAMEWFSHAAGVENHPYTVWDAVTDYQDHLNVNNSAAAASDAHDHLNNHLTDKFKKIPIADLKTAQIKRWHQGLVRVSDDAEDMRRSKDGANKLLSKLKAALNLAFNSGLAAATGNGGGSSHSGTWGPLGRCFWPMTRSRYSWRRPMGRSRPSFRPPLHRRPLWRADGLRAQDLSLERGTLRMDGKTGERGCYLSDAALAWFKGQAKSKLLKAMLLPRDDGEPWGTLHRRRPMKEAVQAAKLARETVFYSLRRYHISKALAAGVPVQVVAENCGTSVRMIEKHYGKFLPQDRRDFFNQVKLG